MNLQTNTFTTMAFLRTLEGGKLLCLCRKGTINPCYSEEHGTPEAEADDEGIHFQRFSPHAALGEATTEPDAAATSASGHAPRAGRQAPAQHRPPPAAMIGLIPRRQAGSQAALGGAAVGNLLGRFLLAADRKRQGNDSKRVAPAGGTPYHRPRWGRSPVRAQPGAVPAKSPPLRCGGQTRRGEVAAAADGGGGCIARAKVQLGLDEQLTISQVNQTPHPSQANSCCCTKLT